MLSTVQIASAASRRLAFPRMRMLAVPSHPRCCAGHAGMRIMRSGDAKDERKLAAHKAASMRASDTAHAGEQCERFVSAKVPVQAARRTVVGIGIIVSRGAGCLGAGQGGCVAVGEFESLASSAPCSLSHC